MPQISRKDLRSKLFDSQKNLKLWRANKLQFLDSRISDLKELLKKLHTTHPGILNNLSLLKRKIDEASDLAAEEKRKKIRGEQNKIKAAKEKDKRFALRLQVTVKTLTNGKCDFNHLQKESKKVKAEEIDLNCVVPPRFHMDTLEYLVGNELFF